MNLTVKPIRNGLLQHRLLHLHQNICNCQTLINQTDCGQLQSREGVPLFRLSEEFRRLFFATRSKYLLKQAKSWEYRNKTQY